MDHKEYKFVIINKGWHTNIINVGQSIFECHDIIPIDVKTHNQILEHKDGR
jgi:hypothetical protein